MTPETLAKSGTEAAHQTALFAWAALQVKRWPELRWLHHIPNGGSRGDDAKSRAIRGSQMKAQGVRTGVADVCLPVRRGGWSGLYIEMKKPSEKPVKATSKGGVSDDQAEFGAFVQSQGFGWIVCYSWEEAAEVLTQYLTYFEESSWRRSFVVYNSIHQQRNSDGKQNANRNQENQTFRQS